MSAVGMVARAEFRQRRWALLGLAAATALGLGGSLGAFAAAYRTDRAYPAYVRRADVTDLVVNPSLSTVEFDRAVRALPHLRGAWVEDQLTGGVPNAGEHVPATAGALIRDTGGGEVHGTTDGRYTHVDRPMITDGRTPTGTHEVFVTSGFRAELNRRLGHTVTVGDAIPVVFFRPGDLQADLNGAFDPNRVVKPLGTERLRVSGFGRLPDEVLDDGVFPRSTLLVSPDVSAKYGCLRSLSGGRTVDELYARAFPPNCSRTYRYWALDIDHPANVPVVKREIEQLSARLNDKLPAVMKDIADGPKYIPILTTRADLEAQVHHSIQPTVVAFVLFGVLAGLATMLLTILGTARIIRQARPTDRTADALGLPRPSRACALAAPVLLSLLVAIAFAAVVGYVASRAGPAGEVRRVEPHAGSSLPMAVAFPVIAGFALLVVFAVVAVSWNTSSMRSNARNRPGHGPHVRATSPAVADGVRTALSTARGGILLTGACCVAVTALVAASVFGANLTALVGNSQRYGWPWDLGVLTDYGYGGTDLQQVHADLAARDDIASYDLIGFAGGTLDGARVAIVYGSSAAPVIALPVVDGRAPRTPDEAAIGTATAHRLGVAIGDRVALDTGTGSHRVTVVGTTVLPAIGQYLSDRSGLGVGVFTLVPAKRFDDQAVTFIGMHLAPGAHAQRTATALDPLLAGWDETQTIPFAYPAPIRPAEIVNAEGMRRGPIVLAGLLATALVAALALAIAATVGARRREFAIYRAIGFTRGQVGRSVRWQALTTVAIGVVVGVPAGVLVGRWTWRRFAGDLGVALHVTVPIGLLATVAVVAFVVALLAAARPAYRASHMRPAEVLRAQ